MKDPYVYENSNVLINLANIKNQKLLDEYESTIVQLEISNLLKNQIDIESVNDIFKIHKKLFNNIYEWSGKSRTINIFKEEPILDGLSVNYANYDDIENKLNELNQDMNFDKWNELSKKDLIHKIVVFISSIWQIHPFREGNTRTVIIFLYFLMKKVNLKLNTDFIKEHTKYFRNALVLASIGEYSEYEHLENIILDAASVKKVANGESVYQNIKDYNLKDYNYNYHHIKK